MNKKLYVGNLLYEATEDQLRDLFSQAGEVVSAQVIRFADSGRSKGFAFVEMIDEAAAQKDVEMYNEYDFMGRKLIVNEARPKTMSGGRGNFDRNRRFGGEDRGGYDRSSDRGENRGAGDSDMGAAAPQPEVDVVPDMPEMPEMTETTETQTPETQTPETPKEE